MLKPGDVIKEVEAKTSVRTNQSNHTSLWKAFDVRTSNNSESKFDTMTEYCS